MNTKEKKVVSAVIYLYNNQDTIVSFVKTVATTLDSIFERAEIIVVNDASTDNSVELVKNAPELKAHHVSIIQMSFHQGIEVAMTAGVDLSLGDFIYEFDDLVIDYDISLIEKAYRTLLEGNDIVSVSPNVNNSFTSEMFYRVYNRFSNSGYNIQSDRFRVLSRRSINRAYSISKSIPYRKALYANSGLKMEALFYKPGFQREKTVSFFRNRMALNTLIIYTNLAFKISITITLVLFLFTVATIFYTILVYFGDKKPIEGWTTLMMVISGSFSGLFFLLAIIIKYLSLLVELIYTKKVYLFEKIDSNQ